MPYYLQSFHSLMKSVLVVGLCMATGMAQLGTLKRAGNAIKHEVIRAEHTVENLAKEEAKEIKDEVEHVTHEIKKEVVGGNRPEPPKQIPPKREEDPSREEEKPEEYSQILIQGAPHNIENKPVEGRPPREKPAKTPLEGEDDLEIDRRRPHPKQMTEEERQQLRRERRHRRKQRRHSRREQESSSESVEKHKRKHLGPRKGEESERKKQQRRKRHEQNNQHYKRHEKHEEVKREKPESEKVIVIDELEELPRAQTEVKLAAAPPSN